MEAIIITIGDELLIGQTVDTNAAWIALALNAVGIKVKRKYTVADNVQEIKEFVTQAMTDAPLVLITGGLGPTNDDITKQVLCSIFNTQLELYEPALEQIKEFIQSRNLVLNANNYNQAMLPKSCVPLTNKFGTAPGMWFERQDSVLVSLPGVPFEMKALMSNEVIPLVAKRWTLPNVVHKSITVGGIAEAMLAEKLSVWESELPEYIKLAYLPSPGIIRLRMSVYESDNAKDEQIIVHANKLKSIIPEHLISLNGLSLSEVIGKLLLEKQWNISTAESCTGGAIAAEITSVSGASDYFKGSVVAYHNSIKQNLLNVPSEYIENYGAVSKQVAESMANGVNKLLNTEISVAVTGVAGPTGGTTDKPVGTVWIATSIEGKISSKKYQFGNSRDINIQRTVNAALLNLIIELRRKN